MKIVERNLEELKPADYNPRKKSEHVIASIKESIGAYGWLAPVVVNKNPERLDVIVGGHRRIEAAKERGEKTVPTIEVNLSLEDEKKANLRLNAQEEFDKHGLAAIINDLHTLDADSTATLGFSPSAIAELLFTARYGNADQKAGLLAERFLIPPFSVFDSKQERWQKRKKQWHDVLGNLAETREDTLAGKTKSQLSVMKGINKGVSIFDPVLSEVIYTWFLPKEGKRILDPFAGSLARGGVAATLGHDYTGIEIRKTQLETNEKALKELAPAGACRFILGDSKELATLVPAEETFDLIFSCPPYYDLEIYSSNEQDLSAKQTYEEFMRDYSSIFEQAAARLKPNRFAVLVLGDIRDEKGFYRNFIRDNIGLFERLGFKLYNEIIYVQMLATAPFRAERHMRKRKVVKTHQNILTFYNGDAELLRNPQLLEAHLKVLTFFNGDPEEIKGSFKNPPDIERDVFAALEGPPEDAAEPEERT